VTTPTLKPGYAYVLEGPLDDALTCPDEFWDTVVIDLENVATQRHLGVRVIDGARCNVFAVDEGMDENAVCAQVLAMGGGT